MTPKQPTKASFRRQLVEAAQLAPLGADGLYALGAEFEAVVEGIQRLITRVGADEEAVVLHFPPMLGQAEFTRTGYLSSFPHLAGAVFGFTDDHALAALRDRDVETEATAYAPAGLMLVSAACHPAFAMLAESTLPRGRRLDILGQCFRREPSGDPFRMQAFRQREYLYLGDAKGARAHLERWTARSGNLLRELGLPVRRTVANDPFFGRGGRLLARSQRDSETKTELVIRLFDDDTALSSANYHGDHFGRAFGITTANAPVHSSCIGFGLERIALALMAVHGVSVPEWPDPVHQVLQL